MRDRFSSDSIAPTPLESALLRRWSELHREQGFPSPDQVQVTSRDDTGAGRYVGLRCAQRVQLPNGYHDVQALIEMEGIDHGMLAQLLVEDERLIEIEIATYGDVTWDGEEREWSLVPTGPS